MAVGSVLVGIALALVVAAFLARPFGRARATDDLDQAIEGWVAKVRAEPTSATGPVLGREGATVGPEAPAGACFCHQCGREVSADARFCSRCGARLPEEIS